MDSLSAVDVAVSRGKASLEAASTIRKRLEPLKDSSEELGEVHRDLLDLESRLLESQNEILGLKALFLEVQEDNLELKKKNLDLAQEQEQSAAKPQSPDADRYQLVQKGGASVWVVTGTDRPYYCPTCFSGGDAVPLQQSTSMFSVAGTHHCARCGGSFNLK